jgi:hypothetical protein
MPPPPVLLAPMAPAAQRAARLLCCCRSFVTVLPLKREAGSSLCVSHGGARDLNDTHLKLQAPVVGRLESVSRTAEQLNKEAYARAAVLKPSDDKTTNS